LAKPETSQSVSQSVSPSLVYGSQSERVGEQIWIGMVWEMLTFEICLCIICTSTDIDMDT